VEQCPEMTVRPIVRRAALDNQHTNRLNREKSKEERARRYVVKFRQKIDTSVSPQLDDFIHRRHPFHLFASGTVKMRPFKLDACSSLLGNRDSISTAMHTHHWLSTDTTMLHRADI
jgi:hypothetical protein